jgi:ribosome-binding factor A
MASANRINELILEELAKAVNREVMIEDALITITYVECTPDLKQAKIGFSVLPDRLAGTAMKKLTGSTNQLVGIIRGRIKLRRLPRFIWEFDSTEREANKIENLIAKANEGYKNA